MAGLLSIFAEFEREMMRERVKAGLAEARRRGKQLGRPRTAMSHKDTIIKMYESKISQSEIARQLGIKVGKYESKSDIAKKIFSIGVKVNKEISKDIQL